MRHVRIDLSPSGLTYAPGDSIGICAPNDPDLVEACLRALDVDGHELVPCPDGTMRTVRDALRVAGGRRPARWTAQLELMLDASASDPEVEADALRRLTDGDDGAEPADADLLDLLEAFPSSPVRGYSTW